jgi:hypothetical protein
MKRLLFFPVLGFAAMLAAAPASAQSLVRGAAYVDDGRQAYYEARQGAYDNGYREGIKQGEKDGRSRKSFSYQDERTWQKGDKGYNRSYGDLNRYRQQFRVGYSRGYEDGYRRYGPAYGPYGNDRGRAVPRGNPNQYPGGYGYPDRGPGGYGYPGQYPRGSRYPNSYPDTSRYPGGYGRYGDYGLNAAYMNGVNDGVEKGREDAGKRRSYDPLRHSWYRSGDHDYKRDYGSKDQYKNVYRDGFKEGYDRGYREGTYRR